MRRKGATSILALNYLLLVGANAHGQTGSVDEEQLRKDTQNPVAALVSVPFQNNINFPIGRYGRVQDVLNIQPVVPLRVTEGVSLITRWITPVVYQPDILTGSGGANGLGDLNPTFFVAPANPGKLIWGFGPTLLLPTATDRTLGQGKWAAGPALVALVQPKSWTIGFLANNMWSYAGSASRAAVNQLTFQYFVNYNMKAGWYMGSQPIITSNWKVSRSNSWTVPFGWAFGRVTRAGGLPVNVQLGAYYNLIHPIDLPYGKWQVRLQVALLFPLAE